MVGPERSTKPDGVDGAERVCAPDVALLEMASRTRRLSSDTEEG